MGFDTQNFVSIQKWKLDERKVIVGNNWSLTLMKRHIKKLASDHAYRVAFFSKLQFLRGWRDSFVGRFIDSNVLGTLS